MNGMPDALDPDETLERLAGARIQAPKANPPWQPMPEDEAREFGDGVAALVREGDPVPHLDVSGAVVEGVRQDAADGRLLIADRRIEGLLAERTVWRAVVFLNCEFTKSTFAEARFEGCTFEDCTFDATNISDATLDLCEFVRCVWRDCQWLEPVWMATTFRDCALERVSLLDSAMRDIEFAGGEWREMQLVDGLLIRVTFRGTKLNEVTFTQTHAPYTRFEQVSMYKVYTMSKGFPGSVFEQVEAVKCGFVSGCYLNESQFIGTRFVETGFPATGFVDFKMTPGCRFENCDFSGALFQKAELAGVHFVKCSMAMTLWEEVNALETWFFGCLLRGVDFGDTELRRAVFTDADIIGAKFQPERTIGADFRGTEKETV